jgi:hypothetical protein
MSGRRWQEAFLATAAILGEPLDRSLEAIDGGAACSPDLLADLRSASREVRARALARVLAGVAADLDQASLQ